MPCPSPPLEPTGGWGEACFLARALALGLRLSRPFDSNAPYDFVVESRGRLLRVQVKTVAARTDEDGYRVSTTRGRLNKRAYTAADIDLLAVFTAADRCWYLLPVSAFTPRLTIRLRPHRRTGEFEPYREAWWLLDGPIRAHN